MLTGTPEEAGTVLRRLRGTFGMAAVWGIVWAGVGAIAKLVSIPGVLSHLFDPNYTRVVIRFTLHAMQRGAWAYGVMGAIGGWLFAAALSTAERRRNVYTISVARAGLWGTLGGAALPFLLRTLPLRRWISFDQLPPLPFSTMTAAILGGTCAMATILLARRASRPSADAVTPAGEVLKEETLPKQGPLAFNV